MSTESPRRPLPGPDCVVFGPLLPLLHGAELDAEEVWRIRQHVQSCAWCQHELATYDALDDALRLEFGGQAIPFLSLEDVMYNTDPAETAPGWIMEPLTRPPAEHRRHRPSRFSGFAAIAAAILVVAFAGAVFAQHGAFLGLGSRTSPTVTIQVPGTSTIGPAPATTPALYFGANGSNAGLYALNSRDGSVAWRFTGPSFEITPVVVQNVVYAVSADDVLYAVRAPAAGGTTGQALWHVAVRPGAAWLLTDGHTLYLGSRVAPSVSTDAHGFIDSYSLSGQRLWTNGYDAGDTATCAMSALPGTMTVANGFVYASSNCPRALVEGLRASDGAVVLVVRSSFPAGTPVSAGESLTVASSVLYTSSAANGSGFLCAFGASNGERLWCHQLSGQDIEMSVNAPVIENGTALVTTDLDIYALRTSDGTPLWTQHIGQLLGRPAGVNGLVFVAGGDRILHALRVADGHELWRYAMTGNGSDPVLGNEIVYLNSYVDGTGFIFTALRASDGSVLWQKTIVATGTTPPVIG
ncbi:MAG TPA: PQQ-binding-like beta-propeller repeat protein [Ktedonobacterales bacterium]|nr:PQQ-binding-like beta-propeller repeat protein [Ktedonobacterales bacterium]